MNLYGFADGDPVNFSDPFGLTPYWLLDPSKCEGGTPRWYAGLREFGRNVAREASLVASGETCDEPGCRTGAFLGVATIVLPTIRTLRVAVPRGSPAAQLVDGYYEAHGFRFSQYYYEKLWATGRGAPSLTDREILQNATNVVADPQKAGFFRYTHGGWEMVYNPTTREVWHLQPLR
jgi:hypothetical protein